MGRIAMVIECLHPFENRAVKKTLQKEGKKRGDTKHPTLHFMLLKMHELYFDFAQIRRDPGIL
jgi:hypothetical protein